MNRFKIRLKKGPTIRLRAAVVGVLALLAAVLSGCGTGQISQTAAQEPAVNGNKLNINNVLLRDIRIHAVQPGDFVQPGQ